MDVSYENFEIWYKVKLKNHEKVKQQQKWQQRRQQHQSKMSEDLITDPISQVKYSQIYFRLHKLLAAKLNVAIKEDHAIFLKDNVRQLHRFEVQN